VFGIIGFTLPNQWGNNNGYSAFDDNGTLTMTGDATVWDDQNFDGLTLGSAASAPEIVSILDSGNLVGYGFDGNVILEQLYGGSELSHGYKVGSNVYPHVHWMPTTNQQGDVTWFLEYTWTNDEEIISGPTTINVTASTSGEAWRSFDVSFPAIDGSSIGLENHFIFRLYRDPTVDTDTYGADAVLLSFGIHYEADTLGSSSINSK
jgi:hypothetical protein